MSEHPMDVTLPPATPPESGTLVREGPSDTIPPRPADLDATLAPATTLSLSPVGLHPPGYEILGELGRGGMGVVYKARQLGLNRLCALKMILAGGHAGAAELARFRTEAEAIARLQHPNIVQVYEIGEHEGKPFFSLEFCAEGSLDRKLAGTLLEPGEAARLGRTLAEAIQAAHTANVIHRDLKPANVLLTTDGVAKITDFGLAKKLDESGQTQTGAIMGTPSYMAPEQAEGKDTVGPLADVYALGAILYDCLTGRPPFRAATSFDTILQVVSEEPVPPTQLNGKIPRDLETITLKCLAKEPGRRYASAQELADDLGRFLNGEPIRGRPVSVIERGSKWVRRHRALSGALALAGLLLLAGVVVSWVLTGWALNEAKVAREATSLADDRAIAAKAAQDEARAEARRADQEKARAQQKATEEARAREAAQAQFDRANRELTRAEWLLYGTEVTRAQRALTDLRPDLADRHLNRARWDFRGIEHDLLSSAQQQLDALVGVYPGANLLALSPPGTMAYVASRKSPQILLVDLRTARPRGACKEHRQPVSALVALPTGHGMVSGDLGGNLIVWDGRTGRLIRQLPSRPVGLTCLLALPDGGLAAGYQDGTITVWDPQAGTVRAEWKAFTRNVQHLAYLGLTPGAIASAGADENRGFVRLWVPAQGPWKKEGEFSSFLTSIPFLSTSADGRRLVVGGRHQGPTWFDNRALCLTLTPSGQVRGKLQTEGHSSLMAHCELTPDGRWFVSAGTHTDPTLRVWNAVTLRESRRLEGVQIATLRATPDSRRVVYLAQSGELRVMELHPRLPREASDSQVAPLITAIDSTADGRLAVTAHADGSVRVRDAAGQLIRLLMADKGYCKAKLSPDGSRLVTFGAEKIVRIWRLTDGQQVATLTGHQEPILAARFLPGGKLISACARVFRVWDLATSQELTRFPAPSGVDDFDVSPDGTRLIVGANGTQDTCLTLLDARDGRKLTALVGHTPVGNNLLLRRVFSEAFSPGGNLIASSGQDGTVRLWDGDGKPVHTFRGHADSVYAVRFSPDGTRLLSAGRDGTLRVWSIAARSQLLELRPSSAALTSLHVASNGSALLAGGLSGQLFRHDLSGIRFLERMEVDDPTVVLTAPSLHPARNVVIVHNVQGKPFAAWSLVSGRPVDLSADLTADPATGATTSTADRAVWTRAVPPVYLLDRKKEKRSDQFIADRLVPLSTPDLEWHLGQAAQAAVRSEWLGLVYHLRQARVALTVAAPDA